MHSKAIYGVFTALLVVLALALGQEASARSSKANDILKKINLTAEQKEQLQSIRKGDVEQIKKLRSQKVDQRKKMDDAMVANSTKEELRALHSQIQETETKIAQLRFEQILKIRELLTPEQRTKFKELKDKHREKWKQQDDEDAD